MYNTYVKQMVFFIYTGLNTINLSITILAFSLLALFFPLAVGGSNFVKAMIELVSRSHTEKYSINVNIFLVILNMVSKYFYVWLKNT